MLTIFEEIELHRVREHAGACCVGFWLCLVVIVGCLAIEAGGGPRACGQVAAFESFVCVLFFAAWRRLRRRQRKLEEFL